MNDLIPILYEDELTIVFDKPAGLLVVPTPKNEQKTLVNLVNKQYAEKALTGHLYPCHRLDRDTSGVIIFAKDKNSRDLIEDLFYKRRVKKWYVGFVQGRLKRPVGEWRAPVIDLDAKKFRKRSQPQEAITRYRVIEQRKDFSVVEIQPITGRTNQIRIHFAQMKHPLVGDRKYAFARDYQVKFRRPALHAWRVEWINPGSSKKILVESQLAKDMEQFLKGG